MAKQKMKTKRAAKKRFRVTGKGRIKVGCKGKRHMLTGKARKQKRNLLGMKRLGSADEAMAKSLLPYA